VGETGNKDGFELLIPANEVIRRYRLIQNDVEGVHAKEKIGIRSMLKKFGSAGVDIGVGFKRAYGTVMSGDSFQLFVFSDDSFLFVFSDVSGHGLEAYTTYIKLRSAAILAVRHENERIAKRKSAVDCCSVVTEIVDTFTNIMEDSISRDFSSVIFTFVSKEKDGEFIFRFFNRGMYYPILTMSSEDNSTICMNLNEPSENWEPSGNSPLGSDFRILLDSKYYNCSESVKHLEGGARICFFTDGIIEATNEKDPPAEFGVDHLKKILRDSFYHFPQAAINMLYHEVYDFIGDPARQEDDMTAVIIDIPRMLG
jgi:hypothetical protein